ncbi:MAG: TlyA family RNA methyltransferase [Deltaproteobacteria bacterium]|nr:TlyA family RNA methyltransferase [Deltaproteobacteria bacterium]
MAKGKRVRLDDFLVARGDAADRREALALVLARRVYVAGQDSLTPGLLISRDAVVRVAEDKIPYVSRGGLKLAAALDSFRLDVAGCVAVDIGASTGGFTDCLIQRGAARVYAVDVGRGLLHEKLRRDARVVVVESCNARTLGRAEVPEAAAIATLDVSFISLDAVLPPVIDLLAPRAWVVALVKPQFEAERCEVEKGGVVRDEAVRRRVVEKISAVMNRFGVDTVGTVDAPIAGAKGNREVLLVGRKRGKSD